MRLGKAGEFSRPEVFEIEQLANLLSCAGGNDQTARYSKRLQPRCQVWRHADHRLFLCRTLADQVTDDYQPGGDADPRLEFGGFDIEATDGVDRTEAGAHPPLGIVLMCPRIAEIDQYPVAHVLGDEAIEPCDDLGDGTVIGADNLAQIFRVKTGRERCRADQVAEHHGQLAAFGIGRSWYIGCYRCHRGRGRSGGLGCTLGQGGDGIQQAAAMPDRRNPEFAKIVGGQPQQHLAIDIVIAESRRVLFEPQLAQPRRDIHAVTLGSEERQPLMDEDNPLPFKLPVVALR